MKKLTSFGLLSFIIGAIFFVVAVIKSSFEPSVEQKKGAMTHAEVKETKVADNSKGWMYAEFSRWHIPG